jgi:hypothetical protein
VAFSAQHAVGFDTISERFLLAMRRTANYGWKSIAKAIKGGILKRISLLL